MAAHDGAECDHAGVVMTMEYSKGCTEAGHERQRTRSLHDHMLRPSSGGLCLVEMRSPRRRRAFGEVRGDGTQANAIPRLAGHDRTPHWGRRWHLEVTRMIPQGARRQQERIAPPGRRTICATRDDSRSSTRNGRRSSTSPTRQGAPRLESRCPAYHALKRGASTRKISFTPRSSPVGQSSSSSTRTQPVMSWNILDTTRTGWFDRQPGPDRHARPPRKDDPSPTNTENNDAMNDARINSLPVVHLPPSSRRRATSV